MKTEIKVDTNYLSAFLDTKKYIREAQREALYQVGVRAKESALKEIQRKVDRPIKYTLKAPYSTKARGSGSTVQVEVAYQRKAGQGKNSQNSYLNPIVNGGSRLQKRSELRLIANGLMKSNEYLLPARDCPLDQYGNVKGGLISRVLAYLQTFNFNGGRRRNKNIEKMASKDWKGPAYFINKGNNGRNRGIFQREGNKIKALFWITSKQPYYKRTLPFYEAVQETFDREFEKLYVAEFNLKIARARARKGI